MLGKDRIERLVAQGIREGVFPGSVLLAAKGGDIQIFIKKGKRSLTPESALMYQDTVFDLASLTKPLGTALALMKLVDDRYISLDQQLGDLIDYRLPENLKVITVRLLLCHSAGFDAWKPYYLLFTGRRNRGRKDFLRDLIIKDPTAYTPGEGCLYSDLGFMILEWVIEKISGMEMHTFLYRVFFKPLGLKKIFFGGTPTSRSFRKEQYAATEECQWRKRVIQGEVHDENAFAVGGYSGHAGMFGTARETHILANLLREHFLGYRKDFLKPQTVKEFFTRQRLCEGSTWALGWDTPTSGNSSSGRFFSRNSVGHLGFTGTSLWMDLEKDVTVVFLTNRIHPTRKNERIREFRPLLHDAVMEELGEA